MAQAPENYFFYDGEPMVDEKTYERLQERLKEQAEEDKRLLGHYTVFDVMDHAVPDLREAQIKNIYGFSVMAERAYYILEIKKLIKELFVEVQHIKAHVKAIDDTDDDDESIKLWDSLKKHVQNAFEISIEADELPWHHYTTRNVIDNASNILEDEVRIWKELPWTVTINGKPCRNK